MNRKQTRPVVLMLVSLLLSSPPAGAAGMSLFWSQGPTEQIANWSQQVADFDGDGQLETVLIESRSGKASGRLTVRDLLSGRVEFQSDSIAVGLSGYTMELVDVDGDGRQDVALLGDLSMPPFASNYYLFGFDGLYRLKDQAAFNVQGALAGHVFAQLYPDTPLELAVPRIGVSGYGFQVQVFGQPVLWADVVIPGATVGASVYAFDANANGLDELYIKCSRTLYMYAHDDAVAAVPGMPPAAAARLALASPYPNPSRGGATLAFTLPARAPVTLRVIDAAGRLVREIAPGLLEPGEHSLAWDACDDSGRRLSPGVYWLDVEAGGERGTRKLVQLR